ncbi:chemotaxis protein CheB [Pontibacter korlensis]|uniref:protein-glutamate methylesterase n=1 Tax=Pontibacter korlensis TaxID=400092 RepID=A0A0E3UWU0_9BACT|nr:chemotaxis protein CheB [Pontibacter korlensis]AKD03667.1 chemotaxis protein [Pontibacter korlensis]
MIKSSKIVVMGGSWGGLQASLSVLKELPATYPIPIVLVLHRLRNFEGSLPELYDSKTLLKAVEVDEKEEALPGHVYLAPSNYHVLLEKDQTFSLDDSELENYSRPAIDVTFTSAADVYGSNTIGILLSGASRDGSAGLKYISDRGGTVVVQDPAEAELDTMPLAAIDQVPDGEIMNLEQIQAYLLSLT